MSILFLQAIDTPLDDAVEQARSVPVTTRLRAVVCLVPEGTQTQCIGLNPVPMFTVPLSVAASKIVPADWTQFQLVDFDAGSLWLIKADAQQVQSAMRVRIKELPDSLDTAIRNYGALGFRPVAVKGGSLQGARTISQQDLHNGAQLVLERHRLGEGTHLTWDTSERPVLSMVSTKAIEYDIVHTHGPVFHPRDSALEEMANGRPVLFIVDRNVERLYGQSMDAYATLRLDSRAKLVIEATEGRKNAAMVGRICRMAAKLGFPRQGLFVAVGGGVTLDTVGLAASVYRRGIGYLRIPTTLIGLVDAGVGIKQGVNFAGRKNLVGTFYPPTGVINDFRFLRTLPPQEVSCGFAEIIKIALVCDRDLFELVEYHGRPLYDSNFASPTGPAQLIPRQAAKLMLDELWPNLHETDLRRLVDFGHTFSPTIESQSRYEIPHGFAVAMDMMLSTAIAVVKGVCVEGVVNRLARLLRDVGLPYAAIPARLQVHLEPAMTATRQHRKGNLNLVVPASIGSGAFLQHVSAAELNQAVRLLAVQTLSPNIARGSHACVRG